jgi:hypothetical protein
LDTPDSEAILREGEKGLRCHQGMMYRTVSFDAAVSAHGQLPEKKRAT